MGGPRQPTPPDDAPPGKGRPANRSASAGKAGKATEQQQQQQTNQQQQSMQLLQGSGSPQPPPGSAGMGQSSDEKRSSLLDVVRDNLNRQGKSMMYRVVVTGELRNVAERAEYGAHNQKFFKQYQGDADLITGMLMVLQDTFIHALEASQKVSLAFLRELGVRLPPPLAAISDQVKARADLEAYMRGPLPVEHRYVKNVRVLLVLEDAGQRFFPFWASRVVEANPNASAVYVDEAGFAESAVAKTIADLCVAFCNIGSGLSNLTKNDLKNALDELPERFKDLMPSAEILRFIAGCKRIMSIDEWLDIFDGHVRVPKESDLVWPMYKAIVI